MIKFDSRVINFVKSKFLNNSYWLNKFIDALNS